MKKGLKIFTALTVAGLLLGCTATPSRGKSELDKEIARITEKIERLKAESKKNYEPAADGQEGEVIRELDSGVTHYYRKYGDWNTTKITDSLKANPQVLICSQFHHDGYDNENSRLCFRFFRKDFVGVEPRTLARGSWPYCEYDYIPYRVDQNEPRIVPTMSLSGLCKSSLDVKKAQFIQELRKGETLYAELGNTRGNVQLNGFGDAWGYATTQFPDQ